MEEQGGDLVILQSFIAEHGLEQVLALQWHAHVERMRQNHIAHFPLCLLAKLLSFTENRDIFNVIQVCHKWYAAFKLPTFWEPRIERLAMKLRPRKLIMSFFQQMDNFGIVSESLDSQCRWIVHRNYNLSFSVNSFMFSRPIFGNQSLTYLFVDNTIVQYSIKPRPEYPKNKEYMEEHLFRNQPYGIFYACIPWQHGSVITSISLLIEYRAQDESLWNGYSTIVKEYDWDKIKPHGKGKWTFSDGSTFQGDAVAFDGVPHGTGVDQDGHQVEYFAGTHVAPKGDQGPIKRMRL